MMRSWFPFSDYDFWGYLASGALLLAGIDYAFNSAALIHSASATAAETVLGVLAIYLTGQVVASASGLLLENWCANTLLRSPTSVLLGLERRGPIQSFIAQIAIGRYYKPFPKEMRERIVARAKALIGSDQASIDSIFHVAFCRARESDDARARTDSFRNQYGFCRNLSLTCFIVALLVSSQRHDPTSNALAWTLAVVGVVLLLRFLKFYSHFSAEILRGLLISPEAQS